MPGVRFHALAKLSGNETQGIRISSDCKLEFFRGANMVIYVCSFSF